METIWQDLRHGARLLRLNPGFAAVAILSLALGVGANTAIFQLLDTVRLRTLPVKNPWELALVKFANWKGGSGHFSGAYSSFTNPQWEQIRDKQQVFSGIFAWDRDMLNLAPGGEVRYAMANYVSGDFFDVLGAQPVIGRLFTTADDVRGCGAPGAVISYAFWQREFGGQPSALGRQITLEGHPFPIIGITPANFYGIEVGRQFDVAIPICSERIIRGEDSILDMRHGWWLSIMGRLKPGISIAQASAQLNAISPGILEATVPPVYHQDDVKRYLANRLGAFPADNGISSLRGRYENPLWMLLAIAGAVLLIACANLANLMLARATAREREFGVRLALGASRGRLIRQLLAESLLLAMAGAALGAGLARVLSGLLVSFLSTQGNQLFMNLRLDWRVLGFTASLAILTCVLFGLTPAVRATRVAVGSALKSSGRGMTSGRERFSIRRALVVSQIALSLVLLVGALLFVRSLRNLLTVDAGFRPDGIVEADFELTRLKLPAERRIAYKQELLERVRAIPGVTGAANTNIVPISGNGWNEYVYTSDIQQKHIANFSRITPGYFQTMDTPILSGRDFDGRDTATSTRVAIVTETFARRFFDGANPVGKSFTVEGYENIPNYTYEIVGLVKDTKYRDLRETIEPLVFVVATQNEHPDQSAGFVIRSGLPVSAVVSAVKSAIGEASPEIAMEFRVLRNTIRESLLQERLMATLSSFFGLLAAVLATVGLYGVISYTVARRTNEVGIRMALGAQRRDIVGLILSEAGMLLGVGLVIGAAIALAVARTASSLLFGLKPHDPLTLAAAAGSLAAVALAASLIPAQRASRLDPMEALRDE